MIEDVEAFLEHFGVKGMRWGVINEDKSSESGSTKTIENRKGLSSRQKKI